MEVCTTSFPSVLPSRDARTSGGNVRYLLTAHFPAAAAAPGDVAVITVAMAVLAALLIAAVRFDITDHRIPNALILAGILAGLALHVLSPAGYGFLSVVPGGLGPLGALQGLAIGGAVMLPLYIFRVMGAGDVKLMAAVGAILGPADVVPAILGTFIAGGAVSLATAWYLGRVGQMVRNIVTMLQLAIFKLPLGRLPVVEVPMESVGRTPYGVAVAIGTLGGVIWTAAGFSLV